MKKLPFLTNLSKNLLLLRKCEILINFCCHCEEARSADVAIYSNYDLNNNS